MTPRTIITHQEALQHHGDDDERLAKPAYKLYIFPPVPHCYNISPFGIKLESYFRIHQIPYDPVYTSKFGSKGMIPYITTTRDGNEICDSNVICEALQNEHATNDSLLLTPAQRATSHAMIRMLEEHTAQIGFYYRYGLQMPEFQRVLHIADHIFDADQSEQGKTMSEAFGRIQPSVTKRKCSDRGLTRHSDEELWRMSFDDLDALSDLLGVKGMYFFDQQQPTLLDCAVFGHLSQFLYIPMAFPQQAYLKEQCPNLVAFVDRFRDTFWQDWKQKCERKGNLKYMTTTTTTTTTAAGVQEDNAAPKISGVEISKFDQQQQNRTKVV